MITKKFTTFLFFLSLCTLLIVSHYLGWLAPIEIFFRNLGNTPSAILHTMSVENELPEDRGQLANMYRELEESCAQERMDNIELELLRRENQVLRESLHFFKNNDYAYISADVIGKSIDPVGSSIIIHIGEDDANIPVGAPVVYGGGALIGRVIEVQEKTAIVRLLDDNQSKFAAAILNQEMSKGVVEGGYGLSIRMNFIPQNEIINIGDAVITSGLESGVPKGLVIGYVEAFEKEPYQPFQSAIVSPLQDLGQLTVVSIVIDLNI